MIENLGVSLGCKRQQNFQFDLIQNFILEKLVPINITFISLLNGASDCLVNYMLVEGRGMAIITRKGVPHH